MGSGGYIWCGRGCCGNRKPFFSGKDSRLMPMKGKMKCTHATPLLSRIRPARMTLATYLIFWLAVSSQGSSFFDETGFF
jgi:hypothetical protein